MADVELEIGPTGTIRTIYKDEKLPLLHDLGKVTVKRASNVEWEEISGQSGWTVRAAHDPELAIRLVIRDCAFRQVVAKEGDIAVFVSREAALESEERFFWELLPQKGTP